MKSHASRVSTTMLPPPPESPAVLETCLTFAAPPPPKSKAAKAKRRRPPELAKQVTAERARQIVALGYRYGVDARYVDQWETLRVLLLSPERFTRRTAPDGWSLGQAERVALALPRPPPRPHNDNVRVGTRQVTRSHGIGCDYEPFLMVRNAEGDFDEMPRVDLSEDEEWPITPTRLALSAALDSLPDGHALIVPLMRADDMRSDFAMRRRWASALAFYWGVDDWAYAEWIEHHVERVSRGT